MSEPEEGASQPGGASVSSQILLQRLNSEVAELRNEVASDLRPELAKASQTLQKLEAHILVSLAGRLAGEIKTAVATAFEDEKRRQRRSNRRRRIGLWFLVFVLVVLLAAEIHGDYVSLYSRSARESISSFVMLPE